MELPQASLRQLAVKVELSLTKVPYTAQIKSLENLPRQFHLEKTAVNWKKWVTLLL